MCFWDVKSATCFQRMETKVQPGSLDSEMGIFASIFDRSGSRLITCEADKTIKIWKVTRERHENAPRERAKRRIGVGWGACFGNRILAFGDVPK